MCSAMDNFVQIHELLTAESQYARRQVALKGETEPKNSIYRVMSVPVLCTSHQHFCGTIFKCIQSVFSFLSQLTT